MSRPFAADRLWVVRDRGSCHSCVDEDSTSAFGCDDSYQRRDRGRDNTGRLSASAADRRRSSAARMCANRFANDLRRCHPSQLFDRPDGCVGCSSWAEVLEVVVRTSEGQHVRALPRQRDPPRRDHPLGGQRLSPNTGPPLEHPGSGPGGALQARQTGHVARKFVRFGGGGC